MRSDKRSRKQRRNRFLFWPRHGPRRLRRNIRTEKRGQKLYSIFEMGYESAGGKVKCAAIDRINSNEKFNKKCNEMKKGAAANVYVGKDKRQRGPVCRQLPWQTEENNNRRNSSRQKTTVECNRLLLRSSKYLAAISKMSNSKWNSNNYRNRSTSNSPLDGIYSKAVYIYLVIICLMCRFILVWIVVRIVLCKCANSTVSILTASPKPNRTVIWSVDAGTAANVAIQFDGKEYGRRAQAGLLANSVSRITES